MDVNESNVTIALFRNYSLVEIYRVETSLGRMVIAYSERRRKIGVLKKTAGFIGKLALENSATVVIGNINSKA